MSIRRLLFSSFRGVLLLAALFSLTGDGTAQKKKKAPPGPPQSPVLNMPLPMGIQRGTALDLQLTGANLAEPVALWTSIPGAKATIPADANNGKDNAKLKIRLEVPKDAPLGFHAIRLATVRGISNLRLFCVDDLPQIIKDGKNTNKAAAQVIAAPVVVAGVLGAETADYYKIAVPAGQRLSFELLGRRLGSPFDPQITLFDARNGKELAYSNDAPGLQTDPRLTYTFKEAGEYLIEVRDVMHRGGADYVYRLRVGDFPCATTPIPMAAKRGSQVSVRFAGPVVENVPPVAVNVPADPGLDVIWVAPKGANGLHGWPVALAVSDLDEMVEQEPNDEPAKATRVPVPGAVTGQFHQKGDVDFYALALKKGRYLIQAHTLDLFSPTEVYLTLKNDKGADVARTEPKDPAKSSRIDFTAPADGQYTLAVEHLLYLHGPAESYRITVTTPEPGFDVNLSSDRVEVPQAGGAILPIQSVVRRDYSGPIEVSVVGPPGLSGQTVITSTAGPPPPNQPNQTVGLLYISAAPNVAPGAYPIKVQAKAIIDGKPVVSYANVRGPVGTALAGLLFPPPDLQAQVVVGVGDKAPFALTVKFDQPEATRPSTAIVTISAARLAGFTEEIVLAPIGLPPNVAPVVKSIPEGANEVKVELKVAANAPGGSFPISFSGRARQEDKTYTATAPLATLVLASPFDLKVEPVQLELPTGGKAKLKVIAVRKGNYQGPITLQFRNLPKGVTAAAATIAQGKNEVEVELTAAANAAGKKANANILGTAPAAGNQQNASPNFTVGVVKK